MEAEIGVPRYFDGSTLTIQYGTKKGRDPNYQDLVMEVNGKIISNEATWCIVSFICLNENGLYPPPRWEGQKMFLENMSAVYRDARQRQLATRGNMMGRVQ